MKPAAGYVTVFQAAKIYSLAILLVVTLFYIHTWLIFDVAGAMLHSTPAFISRLAPSEKGKAIILCCFIILFMAHLLEVVGWSVFLRLTKLVSSLTGGFYFVGVSISTLGYGDVVLERPWRQIGPVIAIAGVLKFGCSTAFLFFVIQTVWEQHI
ncbi:ion channel [Oceanimonas smirnovii]|uniref:ion channel n=1 Tax=Oceanimonas smirnovii TaxID=264574 RepID=UPI000379A123|nr:ion channel [Oceanimonas smirnovii]